MKKIVKILLICVIFMTMITNVNAASRIDKSTKTPVNIQGQTFYAGVVVNLNYNQDNNHKAFIGDIKIDYDSNKNMITASVKRSKINEVFGETDTSVHLNIELDVDYHDFSQDEFIVRGDSSSGKYWYEGDGSRTYASSSGKYIGFLSTAMEIWGGNYIVTSTEDFYLFKGDYYLDTTHSIGGDRSLNDFANCTSEVHLSKVNWNFTIEEDVKADFKNVKEVIRNNGSEETVGVTPQENLTIENVYTIYDNLNREMAYVQMFDEEGNPIKLDDDLKITVDSSENINTLVEYFENDNLEEIQVLSFNYSKFFSGDANIKVYVGDKFNTGDVLTLYYYNPEDSNMELTEETVYVDDNKYVSFQLHHFSDYVLVKSDNELKTTTPEVISNNNSNLKLYLLLGGALMLVIIVIVIVVVATKKKKIVQSDIENK